MLTIDANVFVSEVFHAEVDAVCAAVAQEYGLALITWDQELLTRGAAAASVLLTRGAAAASVMTPAGWLATNPV